MRRPHGFARAGVPDTVSGDIVRIAGRKPAVIGRKRRPQDRGEGLQAARSRANDPKPHDRGPTPHRKARLSPILSPRLSRETLHARPHGTPGFRASDTAESARSPGPASWQAPRPRAISESMALPHRLAARLARLFWKIRRPRTLGVRVLLLAPDGRVALVRHSYTDYWYLPGGGVERGEGLDDAARREVREEIGVGAIRLERVIGTYHSRLEGKDDTILLFLAHTGGEAAPPLRIDGREIEAAAWFAPDALPEDLSPATARRLADYRSGMLCGGRW